MPDADTNAYHPLGDILNNVPVHCLACGTLSKEAAGFDQDGDLVCPACESVDVSPVDLANNLCLISLEDARLALEVLTHAACGEAPVTTDKQNQVSDLAERLDEKIPDGDTA